jgi:hypothetical protein
MRQYLLTSPVALLAFGFAAIHAQTSSPLTATQATGAAPPAKTVPVRHGVANAHPLPLNHVYWHFFMYQEHLEKVAAEHEKQGKDGSWLRDHFQKSLGFDYREFNIVRATALFVSQEIAKLNQREQKIIESDRAAMKANSLPQGVPPPGIPMLKLITLDRETLLNTQIEQMDRALGPEKAQVLRSYLMQTVQNGPKPSTSPAPAQVGK